MTTLTTRATKGSTLTYNELDANFSRNAQAKVANYTVVEGDNNDTIECSGTFTVTLPDAAAIVAAADTGDFEVTVYNSGSGTITIGRTTGADTINGTAANISLLPDESVTLKVNQAGNGYNINANALPLLGITSSVAELNILDGVTSTAAELNILDGVTASAAELNYNDITTLGTAQASKSVTSTAGGVTDFPSGTTLQVKSTPVYGLVVLDTPVELVSSSGNGIWTLVDMSAVYAAAATAGASKAILRVYTSSGLLSGTSILSYLYIRKTGSGLTNNFATQKLYHKQQITTAATITTHGMCECTVNLDGNSDFDWYHDSNSGNFFVTTNIYLVGYYV